MEEERSVIDMRAIIVSTFSSGTGKIVIDPALSDEAIGRIIRAAIEASDGAPFTVIQTLASVIRGDLKTLASKLDDNTGSKSDR